LIVSVGVTGCVPVLVDLRWVVLDIREVTATDVPAVLTLVAQVLGEFGLEFGNGSPTDEQLRGLPSSYGGHGGAFWVAYSEGVLVGTCGVFPVAPHTFELRKMYLLPATRGLGLGTKLLDAAVVWTRARGGTQIVCDTIEAMTRAIAFYEAHGFVRDDGQKRAERCTRGYSRQL
jgi:putative acetyltransferase